MKRKDFRNLDGNVLYLVFLAVNGVRPGVIPDVLVDGDACNGIVEGVRLAARLYKEGYFASIFRRGR